jgi:putative transcription factor
MENEVKPPSTVSASVGAAIAKGRQDKKDAEGKSMSQKDLATKINEKPSVVSPPFRPSTSNTITRILAIKSYPLYWFGADERSIRMFLSLARPPTFQIADYEAGRAIPNVALLAKIERAIGVKLRGDPKLIGTPLPAPGSKKK